MEWEMITGDNSLKRQYIRPQNPPATAAAPVSIKLPELICTAA
jgi:hypothetical protein